MKKIFITLSIILFSTTLYTQEVTGKIIDNFNNPIAYATVQINSNYGVLSNEEGVFTVETANFKTTDNVVISYLGYKSIALKLTDLTSKNYILEEDINELSEIIVSNKILSLEEIIAKVKERIDSNYSKNAVQHQIFKRSTNYSKYKRFEFEFKKATLLSKKARKEVNNKLNEFLKKSTNEPSKNYSEVLTKLLSLNKKHKLKVIKATTLVNKSNDKSAERLQSEIMNLIAKHLEKGATYKVKSGILPIADSLKIEDDMKDLIYKDSSNLANLKAQFSSKTSSFNIHNSKNYEFINKTKYYEYTLKGTVNYNDENIYVINFTPKKSVAMYTGTIYINAYDFALVKATYKFAKGKSVSHNYKLLLGVKFAQSRNNVDVYFQKNKQDLYSLKFINQETESYAFFNRSLKFTKNRIDKSEEKKMIKMEFLVEMDVRDKEELFFIDEQEISKSTFDKFKEAKKYKLNYIPKYMPETWKGYNVLSPIEAIKNYDTGVENSK